MGRRMASSASWRLVRQGERTPFEVCGDTIVGRSKNADLRIEEGYVSRRHARLWIESGGLMVEDLGSANGTFVNGAKVRAPTRLAPGDCVTFDAFEYHVEALAPRIEGDPNATGLDGVDEDDATPAPAAFVAPAAVASPAVAPSSPERAASDLPALEPVAPPAAARVEEPHPKAFPAADPEPEKGSVAPDEDDVDVDDVTGPALFELDTGEDEAADPAPPTRVAKADDGLPPIDEPDFDLTHIDAAEEDVFPGAARMPAPDSDFDFEHGETQAIPPGPAPTDQPLSATVAMPSGEREAVAPTVAMPSAEIPAQPAGGQDPLAPALLGTVGSLEGHLIQLEPGRVLIGRSRDCDICIEHPTVSRQHAELILSGGRCRIRQIEGATGTMLNGNPVSDAELLPGDVLTFGNAEFVYDSVQSLTQSSEGLPPWVWMLVGFAGAGAILAGLFIFVL